MNRLKGLLLCALLLVYAIKMFAQTPEWDWATQAGGTAYDQGIAVATDNQGNQYVTGSFQGIATWGTSVLFSMGESDIFVAKLDVNGNFIWVVSAGGTDTDNSYCITVDNDGNSYLTGSLTSETANFGSCTLTTNSGFWDLFIAKLDSAGNFLWAVSAGGAGIDGGLGITVDSAGNQYVAGYFSATATFGQLTLIASGGYPDIFAAKLDPMGHFLWAVRAGGTFDDYCSGITVDSVGNSYLTGGFKDTANFDSYTLTSSGEYDVFTAKLNTAGNFLWAVKAGGTNWDSGFVNDLDNAGNIYLTGGFQGVVNFGAFTLTSNEEYPDIFVSKLDTSGNFLWAVSAGGTGEDWGNSIVIDAASNIYLTGWFEGTAIFGATTLTGSNSDVFVAKLDTNGSYLWAEQAGGTGEDRSYDVVVDNAANIYLTGKFEGIAVFGTNVLSSSGSTDIFIVKLTSGVPVDDDLAPVMSGLSTLSDAYPNPFRQGETATIKANIADRESGILSIFNLRGQCVTTKQLFSGEQQITMDSRDLPSGIYLYQLKTQTTNITKKLLLLK